MPRFTKDNHTIETSNPRERVRLLSQGYKQEKARTAAVREADAAKAKPIDTASK